MKEQSCAGGGSSSRTSTWGTPGLAQGAAGAAEPPEPHQGLGWDTGLAQTLRAKPWPKPRARMGRGVSAPEHALHVLRGSDPSLEEDETRSPRCSLAVGQLHGMERVSRALIRREIGHKRWRKTGKPQRGTCHLQEQSEQSV